MIGLSRRSALLGSAAAAVAATSFNPLSASAQLAAPMATGIYRSKLGDVEIIQVLDGSRTFNMPNNFVVNVPKDQVLAAFETLGMPKGQVTISFSPVALKAGGKTILIDTGNGLGAFEATKGAVGQHRGNLAAAGIDPKSVDIVLISHFHGDHINGLRNPDGSLAYPNAEVKVPSTELAFWKDEANASKANGSNKGNFANVKKIIGDMKVTPFDADKEVAPGITAIATPGHTPGHTSFVVASGSKKVIVQGDIVNQPAVFMRNPNWHLTFDNDANLSETTRRKFYDMVVAEKIPIIGYHFPFPSVGVVEKDGTGYRLQQVHALT